MFHLAFNCPWAVLASLELLPASVIVAVTLSSSNKPFLRNESWKRLLCMSKRKPLNFLPESSKRYL